MTSRRLVLASASAARMRVLHDAGIDAEQVPSGEDENVAAADVAQTVRLLAERKASAVADRRPDDLVLGCDSLLDVDGSAFGKPTTPQEATRMWRTISGRSASLRTGHCLVEPESKRKVAEVASTLVYFGQPDEDEIAAYVQSLEPMKLAGAFSIDGLGAPFVDRIDGDAGNVLGLSLPLLRRMLAELGRSVTDLWRRPFAGVVRDLSPQDSGWLFDLLEREWGLPVVSISGVHDPSRLEGMIAEDEGDRLGALTYRVDQRGMEVVTLNSVREGRGVASALLGAARERARRAGLRMWLITSNENIRAIDFYQRRGMDLVALHREFARVVEGAKESPVAEHPGTGRIAFRHALEFEYRS
jgi:septum formation protein